MKKITSLNSKNLVSEILSCTACAEHLPFKPRPVFQFFPTARIMICGQAPGLKAHESGIPWSDRSGVRLRQWLDLPAEIFYHNHHISIIPKAFCYPGKGKSGDLPPRKECAELWFEKLLAQMPNLELIIAVGSYAQDYFLDTRGKNMGQIVKDFKIYLPKFLPLPHPSPRNIKWFKDNPWFEEEVLPEARKRIVEILSKA